VTDNESLFLDNGLIQKHLAEFVLQFLGRTAARVSMAARSFPSAQSSGHRMVHFEFGQDRLTQPHPLNMFELAQGAIKVPFEARFVAESIRYIELLTAEPR